MSDQTQQAFTEALGAYTAARNAAAVSGQDPEQVGKAAVVAAAQAHLDEVDPGYRDRAGTAAPHDRRAAPDLKAEYVAANEAWHADPGNAKLAAKAQALAERFAAARTASRVADLPHGRSWEQGVHAPGGDE